MQLDKLKDRILDGYDISYEEALLLIKSPLNELRECADEIRKVKCGNKFELCTIINAKSGRCTEDCKYCAQSVHYKTDIDEYDFLDDNEIIQSALSNEKAGVDRFSIVTSGRRFNKKDVDKLCVTYRKLNNKCSIDFCGSLGLLEYEDFIKLKNAGMSRYHNNLETSRRFFPYICTTHTYDEKLHTIKEAKKAGLEICSGGIFGLGETMIDRIDMAFTLKAIGVKSVPINILNPIKGTPLEHNEPLSYDEINRSIAIYRFILPNVLLRLAGGRALFYDKGKSAVNSGVNSAISGNMLTTYGIETKDDIDMVKDIGFEVSNE